MEIKIGSKTISEDSPTFIIAEAGINHNGDLEIAKQMITKAKEIGADCIKFQTFITEELLTKDTLSLPHVDQATGKKETVYDVIKRTELKQETYKQLKDFAENVVGIVFLSSAIDAPSLKMLVSIGLDAIKIASCDLNNTPLLEEIGKTKLPVILSTGLSNTNEIEKAVETLKQNGSSQIALLHCITLYPPKPSDLNLKTIASLREKFGLIGFSDHTSDELASLSAVALGAKIIEKHFTLDQNMPGPDQKASMEPEPFKIMIEKIRNVEASLGTGVRTPNENEQTLIIPFRRSLVARKDIKAGTTLTEDLIAIKRPGDGMQPSELNTILGKKTKVDVKEDDKFSLDTLE